MKILRDVKNPVRLVLMLGLLSSVMAAQTPACGATLFADVVFDGDLTCSSPEGGLTVGVDGITIDLAAFTLKCNDNIIVGPPHCQGTGAVGIDTAGHTNIVIKGQTDPVTSARGAIVNFDRGVWVNGAGKVTVQDLLITGPADDFSRGDSAGIQVDNDNCPGAVSITGNEVSFHRYGIRLSFSSCVKVQGNQLHHNRSRVGDSHGILLEESPRNTITNNFIEQNGVDDGVFHDGVALAGGGTNSNRIAQNTVQRNFGDGISARGGANGNAVSGNFARLNPPPSPTPILNGIAADLAERNATESNAWRRNNDCGTQTSTIAAGICTATIP